MLSKEELGKQIKHYMEGKKMTQKELAEAIQITPSKLSNYITGKNYPPIDILDAISLALGVSLDALIRGKKNDTQPLFKIENCGDIARLLFAIDDACWYFRIMPKQERYTWEEYDRSTGYPEEHSTNRTRYTFSFGGDGSWNEQTKKLNDMFASWVNMNSFYTDNAISGEFYCNEMLPMWRNEQIRRLSEIPAKEELPDLIDDDGELPF